MIHEKRMNRKGSHSEYLFLFIRELIQEHQFKLADLDAVLVSNGPGSYTGLRIAASAVKGLLFGLRVKLFAANTLSGFAAGVWNKVQNSDVLEQKEAVRVHAVINARRSHLYHQEFEYKNALQKVTESAILEIKEIEKNLQSGNIIVGTGVERLDGSITENCSMYGLEAVSADHLIRLFNSDKGKIFFKQTTAEELESNYISSSQVNNSAIN